MRNLRTSKILMTATILVIAGFQAYWIHRLYDEEWTGLKKRTDVLLKETVQKEVAERIRKNNGFFPPESIESIQVVKDPLREPGKKKATAKIVVPPPQRFPMVLPKGTKIETMVVSNDSVMIASSTRSEKIDSLVAKARAMGGPMRIIINDTTRHLSGFSFPRKEDAMAERTEKLPPRKDSLFFSKHSDTKNFVRIANGRGTAFVSDSSQYKQILIQFSAIMDSIPLKRLDSQYHAALKKEGIKLNYTLTVKKFNTNKVDSTSASELKTNFALVGFNKPYGYQASFENPFNFILGKLTDQIAVSFFLIAITVISFVSLYRNLLAQQKLTGIKNDFISNITHELKTPIATVGVAIEALRNFNAIKDPAKTKEYLDISASELQRLSLLVDKVLKLSMFENKEVELKKENFDLKQLTEEVSATMRLQFEKAGANVSITSDMNNHFVNADKLHITSVIYNLLDNALKYSPTKPVIKIDISSHAHTVILKVIDNGIGIAQDYTNKVFEKFFRVPSNDHHNIKGYGLGLSYVSHVIKKHNGEIFVESEPGNGSSFIVKLPAA